MDNAKFETQNVDGWSLVKFEGEEQPRILDTDLAERLGYAQPRMVRKLIKRLVEDSKLPGALRALHVERTQMPTGGVRETEVEAYYLDERNALRVIRHCDTEKADAVMEEVIDVYLKVKQAAQLTGLTIAQFMRQLDVMNNEIRELKDSNTANATDIALRLARVEARQTGPGLVCQNQADDIMQRIADIALLRSANEGITFRSARMKVENQIRMLVDFPRSIGASWRFLPLDKLGETNSKLAALYVEEKRKALRPSSGFQPGLF